MVAPHLNVRSLFCLFFLFVLFVYLFVCLFVRFWFFFAPYLQPVIVRTFLGGPWFQRLISHRLLFVPLDVHRAWGSAHPQLADAHRPSLAHAPALSATADEKKKSFLSFYTGIRTGELPPTGALVSTVQLPGRSDARNRI